MQETRYGLKVLLKVPYDDAVARATEALKAQGFGVLTTIDVQQTLKAKLDRDLRKYVILGACNPPLADRALHAELEVGLLLPCNVIVYEIGESESVVAAMAPLAALSIVGDNPDRSPSRLRPTTGSGVLSRLLKGVQQDRERHIVLMCR
jgi:uncharacterized protein (DUF302 family)